MFGWWLTAGVEDADCEPGLTSIGWGEWGWGGPCWGWGWPPMRLWLVDTDAEVVVEDGAVNAPGAVPRIYAVGNCSVIFSTIFRHLEANTCRNSELGQDFG